MACSALAITTSLFVTYQEDVLKDYGFLHNIANSVVNHLVPPKLIEPPISQNGTIYKPITHDNEIRLLILEPGAPGDGLECNLVHAQLCWRTKYEALSYHWGDATVKRQMNCSGCDIDITVNLHNALSDLRLPDRQRVLWVDQLCINQEEINEKEKQISLMGSIYSQALQVLIYLGKADQSSCGAIESIRYLDRKLTHVYLQDYFLKFRPFGIGLQWLYLLPSPSIPDGNMNWDQIFNLLQLPWFQRTWVIQEAVLPKNAHVICGDQSIPWPLFERVILNLTYCFDEVPEIYSALYTIRSLDLLSNSRWTRHSVKSKSLQRRAMILGNRGGNPKLLDLIAVSSSYMCSDPRDKVYGMLGVTSQNTGSYLLKPDYSLSPERVYRNFVLWEILENRSLRVFGLISDKGWRSYTYPSWVPNLEKLNPQHSLTGVGCKFDRFDASAGQIVEARASDDNKKLHLRGKIIDEIHTIGKEIFKRSELPTGWALETWKINIGMLKEAMVIWLAAKKRSAHGHAATRKVGDGFNGELHHAKGGQADHVSPNWEPAIFTPSLSEVTPLIRTSIVGDGAKPLATMIDNGYDTLFIWCVNMLQNAALSRRFAGTNTGLLGLQSSNWPIFHPDVKVTKDKDFRRHFKQYREDNRSWTKEDKKKQKKKKKKNKNNQEEIDSVLSPGFLRNTFIVIPTELIPPQPQTRAR
ncbi:Heterokaryon incompatibility protein [Fusarium longipes]|uniref:Heterokaryon incompatibility protein n=1 Tax=Fusarium longipes TaxID=694270 RepID=A0A395T9M5_9HYPO|nr:Heterokaryon incompatibility protein [Fusarium longipes]